LMSDAPVPGRPPGSATAPQAATSDAAAMARRRSRRDSRAFMRSPYLTTQTGQWFRRLWSERLLEEGDDPRGLDVGGPEEERQRAAHERDLGHTESDVADHADAVELHFVPPQWTEPVDVREGGG